MASRKKKEIHDGITYDMENISVGITRPILKTIRKVVFGEKFFPSVCDFFRLSAEKSLSDIGFLDNRIIKENNALLSYSKKVRKPRKIQYDERKVIPVTLNVSETMLNKIKEVVDLQIFPSRTSFFRIATASFLQEIGYLDKVESIMSEEETYAENPDELSVALRMDMRRIVKVNDPEERKRLLAEMVLGVQREKGIV